MLRSVLIYLSQAAWARRIVTRWSIAWRVASRFVAGETPRDAIRVIRELNARGINATLDHLGENVTRETEARQAAEEVISMLDLIEAEGVRSGISIKLSQMGLLLDEALCEQNLRRILEHARSRRNFIRIDMEDSPLTEATLRLFYKMLAEGYGAHVGIVIQAYLYRSETDIADLMEKQARVRLCKGAYKEPPEIAFPKKADVDANYDQLARAILDGSLAAGAPRASEDGYFPPIPAIASHDEARIAFAKKYAAEIGLPQGALEFQMLYGIRRDLQEQLAAEGYPVRVYVPYGTEWYPYFMRRLAERPANLWFFVINLLRG